MKKYKLIVQIEKIKKYLEQGKLQEAYDLAEDVDPKKLKSMSDLSVIAECYFQNRRYLEAKELFEQIYDTVKTRRILAQLVHLSIKLNDIIEANYYLEEFMKIAPEDFYQYIFRYSIDKMMKKPIEVLILDLESLREVEYIESWAYELAKLYFKSGNEVACRKECEKIILWFGSGEYVDRAKALLAYYDGELDVNTILNAAHKKRRTQEEEGVETPESGELEDGAQEGSNTKEQEEIAALEQEEHETNQEEIAVSEQDKYGANQEEIAVSEQDEYGANQEEIVSLEQEEFETNQEETVASEQEEFQTKEEEVATLEQEEFKLNKIEEFESVAQDNQEERESFAPTMGISKHTLFHKKYTNTTEESPESIVAETLSYKEESCPNSTLETKEEEVKEAKIKEVESKDAEDYHEAEEKATVEESIALRESIALKEGSATKEGSAIEKITEEFSTEAELIENELLQEEGNEQGFYEIEVKSNHDYIPHLHSSLWPCLEEKQILLEEVFGNFIRLQSFSESIIDSLERMVHSVYGQHNLVLMGSKNSGQVELAKKYAKLFHKLSFTGSPRVALIDAIKLNHMDLMGKRTQLKDCIMILQNTEELTRDTLIRLLELQQLPRQNIFYILTGQTKGTEQLFLDNQELSNTFPIRITIPEYDLEDYCGFAYDCFTESGYKIEKEAFLLVRNEISEIMKIKRENSFLEVLSYVKQIIQKHEKQNEQLLLELTRAGALEQFELSVLRKEDIG